MINGKSCAPKIPTTTRYATKFGTPSSGLTCSSGGVPCGVQTLNQSSGIIARLSSSVLGKRKRRYAETDHLKTGSSSTGDEDGHSAKKNVEFPLSHIAVPALVQPKSLYVGHETSLPVSSERDVLRDVIVGLNIALT